VPNHYIHYLKALYRVRSRPYFVTEKKPNSSHKEQALGDRGEEKLPFNRKKPPTEPGSGWTAICLDRLGLGEDKKRGRGEERGEKRERETGNSCVGDGVINNNDR